MKLQNLFKIIEKCDDNQNSSNAHWIIRKQKDEKQKWKKNFDFSIKKNFKHVSSHIFIRARWTLLYHSKVLNKFYNFIVSFHYYKRCALKCWNDWNDWNSFIFVTIIEKKFFSFLCFYIIQCVVDEISIYLHHLIILNQFHNFIVSFYNYK